jgi:hypothetical protein
MDSLDEVSSLVIKIICIDGVLYLRKDILSKNDFLRNVLSGNYKNITYDGHIFLNITMDGLKDYYEYLTNGFHSVLSAQPSIEFCDLTVAKNIYNKICVPRNTRIKLAKFLQDDFVFAQINKYSKDDILVHGNNIEYTKDPIKYYDDSDIYQKRRKIEALDNYHKAISTAIIIPDGSIFYYSDILGRTIIKYNKGKREYYPDNIKCHFINPENHDLNKYLENRIIISKETIDIIQCICEHYGLDESKILLRSIRNI